MRPRFVVAAIVVIALVVMGVLLAPSNRSRREPLGMSPSAPAAVTPSPSESPSASPTSSAPLVSPSPSPSPPVVAQAPQAPAARPAPPAPPAALRNFETWEGPDEAVASWYSQRCGRDVLRFGVQQYTKGASSVMNPPDVADLGYRSGNRRLYGNRGAPGALYVTSDGAIFQEWLAVGETC